MPLLYHNIDSRIEAFSTEKDSELPYHVIQSHQIHSDEIAIITDPTTTREDLEGIDAMITNLKNVAIGARTADCVPILLFDPVHKVIASVHSGWRGTTLRISQKTILKMKEAFGSGPKEMKAIIGPSISMEYFQVGAEVVEIFERMGFPMDTIYTWKGNEVSGDVNTGHHIDLWQANRWLLEEAGLMKDNIHLSAICTYKNNDKYFSARAEKNNKCGRIINSIKITNYD